MQPPECRLRRHGPGWRVEKVTIFTKKKKAKLGPAGIPYLQEGFGQPVQADLAITWNKGVHLSRRQFCSVFDDLFSVLLLTSDTDIVPWNRRKSEFRRKF